MLRYDALEALTASGPAAAHLAIGTFDGVHRGHQAVLRRLLQSARQAGARATVLTFLPHPMAVLRPEAVPPLLTSYAQRAGLLEAAGADALVELPFTAELSAVGAAPFVAEYLCGRAQARRLFVGADFTFGARRSGTAETLAVLARQTCGIDTTVVPLVLDEGLPVSSTRIRQALAAGRPGLAARLLGRPFGLEGTVIPGERRGRTIGFPTANLALDASLARPCPGVYAVRCRVAGEEQWRAAVANLGGRPTVADANEGLEVHVLGFEGDLYGTTLEVAFIRRLRGQRRFAGLEPLRAQIARDATRARALLG